MELILIAGLLIGGETEAAKYASRAHFKQQGYDVQLRQLQDRTVSKQTQELAGYALALHRVAVEHRVTFRWSFP